MINDFFILWLTLLLCKLEYNLRLYGSAGEAQARQRHASATTTALNIAPSEMKLILDGKLQEMQRF